MKNRGKQFSTVKEIAGKKQIVDQKFLEISFPFDT